MTNETTSLTGRLRAIRTRSIRRARVLWSELDYAQQRSFLLRTGLDDPRQRQVDELERLYQRD